MISVVNGTSHEINIYASDDCVSIQDGRKLILKQGSTPLLVIEPGTNLNCVKGFAKTPVLDTNIPIKGAVEFLSYDPIPSGDIVVVSNLYRSAVKELGGDTSKLATVSGTVYSSEFDVRPCGCLELAVG
jgi:hypothetical protein